MIKNKNRLILICCIMLCSFVNIHFVEAAFQARYYNSSTSTGITRWNGTNYTAYEYEMKDPNGVSYKAYCMDPGKSLPNGWNDYQCETLSGNNPHSGRFMWILDHLTDNNTVNVLAIRMLAVATGTNNFANNNYTAASIVNYWWSRQCAEGGHAGNTNCSSYDKNYKQYLYGKNDTAESIINSAYQLATQAYDNSGYKGNMSDGGYIKFEKDNGKSSENHIVLKISSDKPIDKNNLKFTCKECEKIDWTWNGSSGEIELTVAQPNCSYTINSYYGASGYYMCSSTKGGSFQKLLTVIHSETNSFEASAIENSTVSQPPYVGKIESNLGGNYYKTYCDEDKVCTEKTKIEIPSYCDDASGKKITITSPKNVVQCVLNSVDDAGNTYKMIDGQVETESVKNPYCSVWCKEDYNMGLPGAKYGDSGRYFILEPTTVHSDRTCYATGPDKSTKNIDIDKFIKDIKSQQEDLAQKFNTMQIAKARLESVKNIVSVDNNTVTCTSTGCAKYDTTTNTCLQPTSCTNSYTNDEQTGADKSYSIVNLTVKNADEGTYNVNISTSSLHDYLGGKYSCSGCSGSYSISGTYRTLGEYQSAYDAAVNAMNAAKEKINATIKHMEECYGWSNNLCFDPDVVFDYRESYNGQIKFEMDGEAEIHKDYKVSYRDAKDKSINNEYSNTTEVGNLDQILENVDYLFCNTENCSNSSKAEHISTLVKHIYYLKKESTGDATFKNQNQFVSNYPHGTIGEVPSGATGPYEDYYYLGAVFPIMFKTPTGVYNWKLDFKNIGQYNNNNGTCNDSQLGRLNEVAKSSGDGRPGLSTSLQYVCVYVVDCPECEYECNCGDNPDCVEKYIQGEKFCIINHPEPECPECEIYCINCIFDGDSATYKYRQISLAEVNPNNRNMGSNWNNEKGKATIKAIENANESIYKESEYSYQITAEQMKEIRDYNKGITYDNEDLEFHSIGNNVYGISEFLDKGQSLGYFKELRRNSDWSSKVWTSIGDHQGPSWK